MIDFPGCFFIFSISFLLASESQQCPLVAKSEVSSLKNPSLEKKKIVSFFFLR